MKADSISLFPRCVSFETVTTFPSSDGNTYYKIMSKKINEYLFRMETVANFTASDGKMLKFNDYLTKISHNNQQKHVKPIL